MRTCWLGMETLGPVMATSASATVGQPRSLDYLPGSQLLGAVAGALYRELGDRADGLLQTGRVRFGDGMPVRDIGSAPIPMPLSFHHPKGDAAVGAWRNAIVEGVEGQPVQLRGGFLDGAAEDPRVAVRFESSERTALQQGVARDGFLYSLHALSAGQRFLARIQVDGSVDPDLADRVLGALEGELRLGRSRSAEFGRVRAEWVPTPQLVPVDEGAMAEGRVAILAGSDWCLSDPETGCPSFELRPEMVGLEPDAFTVLPERCFVRTRSYSPFNSFRGRPDHQRWGVSRGSVVTVRLGSVSLEGLRGAFEEGVGVHRRDGLGVALVGPALLHRPRFEGWRSEEASVDDGVFDRATLVNDPMMGWARERLDARTGRERALELALEWRRVLRGRFGPLEMRSQWGRVRELALAAPSHAALLHDLERGFVPPVGEPVPKDRRSARLLETAWGREEKGGGHSLGRAWVELVRSESTHGLRAARILAALMVREQSGERR